MKSSLDPQFKPLPPVNRTAPVSFDSGGEENRAMRGHVVTRTHRVVRQRAKQIQARRSYVRSLTVPLIVCSTLLILAAFALGSGLYQYQAAGAVDAVQADVAAIANTELADQLMVVLLWFVPASLALLAMVWFRRLRIASGRGVAR